MSMARRPSPFGELLSLRQAMDRLFEDSYVRARGLPYGSVEHTALPLDIYSTPEAIVVEAALPGVKPEDVEITVLGNTLTISGTSYEERTSEAPDFMYQELRRGTFSRTVALPSNLDTQASTATFEHGMLRLSIPKAPEAKPRQIRITPTHDVAASESYGGNEDGIGGEADEAPAAQAGGNDDWGAGSADAVGQVEGSSEAMRSSDEGTADVGQAEGAWEPNAGTDSWTEPTAEQTAEAWAEPAAAETTNGSWAEPAAAETIDAWAEPDQGAAATDAWSDPSATPSSDTWATPDAAATDTSAWGADQTAGSDPYATAEGGTAESWQPQATDGSTEWQPVPGAPGEGRPETTDASTEWQPQAGTDAGREREPAVAGATEWAAQPSSESSEWQHGAAQQSDPAAASWTPEPRATEGREARHSGEEQGRG